MRFQDNLLLQKQKIEQETTQESAKGLLQEISTKIETEYQKARQLHDPIMRSLTRIHARHQQTQVSEEEKSSDNFVKKEIAVRTMKGSSSNSAAFKMYRQLRFDSKQ